MPMHVFGSKVLLALNLSPLLTPHNLILPIYFMARRKNVSLSINNYQLYAKTCVLVKGLNFNVTPPLKNSQSTLTRVLHGKEDSRQFIANSYQLYANTCV